MSDENGIEISQEGGARTASKDILMLFPTGIVTPSHFDLTSIYHPRQDATTVTLHDNAVFELQRSKLSKYSSWFIDQRVSDSNYLYFSNKIDPRFILLPYLEAAPAKFSPMDQLIHSSPLNAADGKTEKLPLDKLIEWKMHEICDINNKLGDDMILYRFNKDKSLTWLRNKVDKVANVLATQRSRNLRRNQSLYVDSFNSGSRPAVSTAVAAETAAVSSNDDIKAAVEIICDQLTDNMAQALCDSYALNFDEVMATKVAANPLKRKADWEVALEQEKEELSRSALMGAKPSSMTDTAGRVSSQQNNSNGPATTANKTNAAGSGGGGAKALKANAAAAKGTKSINSFFGGAKPTK